jgi:sulfopyruvate decarboxylase beta subunit
MGRFLKEFPMHICTTLYEIFDREGIDLILSLPCNKLQDLLGNLPDRFRHIHITVEENGVGISAGASLTSGKPLMLIPSTGLGNSFNALASIHKACNLPLPIVASWRGSKNDPFPGQVPLGKALPGIFTALEIPYTVIEKPEQLPEAGTAIRDAFLQSTPHIILICPNILDANEDKAAPPAFGTRKRCIQLTYEGQIDDPVLTRCEAIEAMVDFFRDAIVVATLGQTCGDLYQVGDRDLNFYVMGGMGQASAIGLGMAVNTDRRVYVLDGDGSLLMNPNILCEISTTGPANLTIIVLDNGTYGTTGDQKTAAYDRIDLELVARSFGIKNTMKAATKTKIAQAVASFGAGPNLLHVPTKPGKSKAHPDLMPVEVKERFMKALSRTQLKSLG